MHLRAFFLRIIKFAIELILFLMENPSLNCANCASPCLMGNGILDDLSLENQKILMAATKRNALKKGAIIFHEGDKADSLFLIQKGSMKLVNYDKDGNEKIIGVFMAGEAVWESLFLDKDATYPYSGIALSDILYCCIERQTFEKIASSYPVSIRIICLLSKKLHDANQRNRVLALSTPKAKVAGLLLYRSQVQNSLTLHLKLDDMASSLSIRPETVSRKVGELIDEGYINKSGQSTFKILDIEGLNEITKN